MSAQTAEILVIGGGLAGSMAAMRLAAAGREVVSLEKTHAASSKVCGEFLSVEAVAYLRAAGIEPLELGARSIDVVRVSARARIVERALPFSALSLSRHTLDEAMLAHAAKIGCEVVRGTHVEHLSQRDGAWIAILRGGGAWSAASTFLACGKHDLVGYAREGSVHGDLVGFKQHWWLLPAQTEALRGAMELFLFPGGYGGLSLVEADAANLCLVVKRNILRSRAGWSGVLKAILQVNRRVAERMNGAVPTTEQLLAIYPIPYGYLASAEDGLWRVGDQAAVIPSFTGDGMSIALHSGALAARMFLAGNSAGEYQHMLRAQVECGINFSMRISKAMMTARVQALAPLVLSLMPGSLAWIAKSTRIPEQALAANAAG